MFHGPFSRKDTHKTPYIWPLTCLLLNHYDLVSTYGVNIFINIGSYDGLQHLANPWMNTDLF